MSGTDGLRIFWNQGVGDHIVCNGLAHVLADRHGSLTIVVREDNARQVARMYLGDPRIVVEPYRELSDIPPGTVMHNTCFGALRWGSTRHFSQVFYAAAGVDPRERWHRWTLVRDLQRERALADLHGQGDYIFVHEDSARGFALDLGRAETFPDEHGLRVVRSNTPMLSPDIFDYLTLIAGAREVHTICSSFLCLVDTCGVPMRGRLVFHRYAKPRVPEDNTDWSHPELALGWDVVV